MRLKSLEYLSSNSSGTQKSSSGSCLPLSALGSAVGAVDTAARSAEPKNILNKLRNKKVSDSAPTMTLLVKIQWMVAKPASHAINPPVNTTNLGSQTMKRPAIHVARCHKTVTVLSNHAKDRSRNHTKDRSSHAK